MPLARQRSRSPLRACAVSATIGMCAATPVRMQRSGLESIHLGYLNVHQDEIVPGALHGLDGFDAIRDDIDFVPTLAQHGRRDFLVDRVVLGQQDR